MNITKSFTWFEYIQSKPFGGGCRYQDKKIYDDMGKGKIKLKFNGQLCVKKLEPIPEYKCLDCGEAVTFNVPRLGEAGGFIHVLTGKLLCAKK